MHYERHPPFADNGLSLALELVCRHLLDERDIREPATVVRLEQVAQYGAAGLDIGVDADEQRTFVGGAHGALDQHVADR